MYRVDFYVTQILIALLLHRIVDSVIILRMEQIVKNKTKRATIKGLPVWHLTGVSKEAVSAIKDTGFWVHYRSFGLDGWYIAASDAMLPHFKAALAKKGVDFEAVKHLPRRFGMLPCMLLHLYMMFGWILGVGGVAHMGKVWFAVTVIHLVCLETGIYRGRPFYAEMLIPMSHANKISDSDGGGVYENMAGTPEWLNNPALR